MNFKIVNRFLVFALSLCTALFFFGNSSIQNERIHISEISQIVHCNSGHQTIQEGNSNQLPIQADSRVEQPTEDDENLDTEIDLDANHLGIFISGRFLFSNLICQNNSSRLDTQNCPIYIRTHSLLI